MDELKFVFANPEDEESIKGLLSEYGLPNEDIAQHLSHFIVAKNGDEMVGVVGLELLAEVGLFRSLAVAPSYLSKGLGKMLFERMLAHAAGQGVKELYLLTTSAETYFAKQGFYTVTRAAVPMSVQNTEEFGKLCPSTAVVMIKRIDKIESHWRNA